MGIVIGGIRDVKVRMHNNGLWQYRVEFLPHHHNLGDKQVTKSAPVYKSARKARKAGREKLRRLEAWQRDKDHNKFDWH